MENVLDLYNRYARQIVLSYIGLEGQTKISRGKVLVVGLGGVGSPLVNILARMGVSNIKLVDRDVVSITDLHRQILYTPADVDEPKASIAKKRLEEENPGINVEAYPININFKTLREIAKDVDVIVDSLDTIKYRYIVNRVALSLEKPYIYSAAISTYGSLMTIIPYKTACLECVYHDIRDSELPRCSTVGIHPSVTNIIASIAADEVINILMGRKPKLYSKLLMFDISKLTLSTVDVYRSPNCRACSHKPNEIPEDIEIPNIELECARDGSGIYIVNVNEMKNLDLNKIESTLKKKGIEVTKKHDALKINVENGVELILIKTGVGIFKVRKPVDDPYSFSKKLEEIYQGYIETKLP